MSERCKHDGTVERLDLPRMSANGPPPRTVWQCSKCGMSWPADPRQLTAKYDRLAEEIMAGIEDPMLPARQAAQSALSIARASLAALQTDRVEEHEALLEVLALELGTANDPSAVVTCMAHLVAGTAIKVAEMTDGQVSPEELLDLFAEGMDGRS